MSPSSCRKSARGLSISDIGSPSVATASGSPDGFRVSGKRGIGAVPHAEADDGPTHDSAPRTTRAFPPSANGKQRVADAKIGERHPDGQRSQAHRVARLLDLLRATSAVLEWIRSTTVSAT